jgi:hypothetical protein
VDSRLYLIDAARAMPPTPPVPQLKVGFAFFPIRLCLFDFEICRAAICIGCFVLSLLPRFANLSVLMRLEVGPSSRENRLNRCRKKKA